MGGSEGARVGVAGSKAGHGRVNPPEGSERDGVDCAVLQVRDDPPRSSPRRVLSGG
jgi:hypothetical protein